MLLGFNAAQRGREIESLTDAQTVDSAMQALRSMFGADIPAPTCHQITRWAADPFTRGSYSFNALGSTPAIRKALAAPGGSATRSHAGAPGICDSLKHFRLPVSFKTDRMIPAVQACL